MGGDAEKGHMMVDGAEQTVRIERLGELAVLLIDNPPVNALGQKLRQGLWDAIERTDADPDIRAIVLIAEGRSFPAGADISEFGKPPQAPILTDLCNRIEACGKPVVAALHGTALGGGLELALAARHRIALIGARLGFPEVGLGILPGAGGTQRLPRLIGAANALRMILGGKPIRAEEAQRMGLVDRVCDKDLPAAALAFARDVIPEPLAPATRDRFTAMQDAAGYHAAVAEARKEIAGSSLPAPSRIVDAVEAAQLLPFDQGLILERTAFLDLVETPEAAALRHVFFAERRVARKPGAEPLPLANLAILGARRSVLPLIGPALESGGKVMLADHDADALADLLEAVASALEDQKASGRLSQEEAADRWARLQPELPSAISPDADICLLAGEYAEEGRDLPPLPECPRIRLGGAGEGIGLLLHPTDTPPRLAEIIADEGAAPEVIATVFAWLRRARLMVVRMSGASLVSSLGKALYCSSEVLREKEGDAVDQILRRWGLSPGEEVGEGGFAGLTEGPGAALMAAMANTGLRALGEGRALRPSDIDLAVIQGLGMPRWSGGPMFHAGRRGLLVLREDLNHWAKLDPALWSPAPMIDEMLREGVTLDQLNEA